MLMNPYLVGFAEILPPFYLFLAFPKFYMSDFDCCALSAEPLNLLDSSSSESRISQLVTSGYLLHEYRQSLEEIGEVVDLPDLHKFVDLEVHDKAKDMPKLVWDWEMSYARTAAQN